jgi:peptide/nickel transport system ATP-binding protein/oligopeptide transport system ATP-binding protein
VNTQGGKEVLVSLCDVRTYFWENPLLSLGIGRRSGTPTRAVDGVNLELKRGETVGLVGESGSGKTTLGRTIVRLEALTGGQILYEGQDITNFRSGARLRRLRKHVQMIFQDPQASLSPRLRVSYLLQEPYRIHKVPTGERYTVADLLGMVELSADQGVKFPHELSGGQARRIGIARALALRPALVIADEPTAGLDVSAAASILNLMQDLQDRFGLTYLLITHDLNVVSYFADIVAVMYLGRLMEVGPAKELFDAPAHPYTRALLEAAPDLETAKSIQRSRLVLPGEIPSPRNPPAACRFHTRCPFVQPVCRTLEPPSEKVGPAHLVMCHFWKEVVSGKAISSSSAGNSEAR